MRSQPLILQWLAIFTPLLLVASAFFFILYRAQVGVAKDRLVELESKQIELQKTLALQGFQQVVSDLNILTNQVDLPTLGGQLLDSENNTNASETERLRQKLIDDFFIFAAYKKIYAETRFIDRQGQEIIRINFNLNQDSLEIVPDNQLQNQFDRYYVGETLSLNKGEIFMSPFDLQVDQGKIVEPYTPTIRFSTPLFDQQERKAGIVILNFLGEPLLDKLDIQISGTEGQFMLLNPEGYWLQGLTPEDEWGFMFEDGQDRTFAQRYPDVWAKILQSDNINNVETKEGLFIFSPIYPLKALQELTGSRIQGVDFEEGLPYRWEIVSYVSPETLAVLSRDVFLQLLPLYLGLIGAIGIAAVIITRQFSLAEKTQARIAAGMAVAEQISAGDLTARLDLSGREDELNRLLRAFDAMTDRLSQLISQVQSSGIQVTSSTTELASASHQLEATLTEQVASTNQISATTQQIAATSEELSHQVEQVAAQVSLMATTASQGQMQMGQMEQTVQQLAIATTSISDRLGRISERANTINSVINTITKVADQTNLLSLNAAIEAEKAGEYGAGFSVVAREIRRLADQTAVATLEIETMVKDMQSAVASGVMEADKFTQDVNQGIHSVQDITQHITQIIEQVTLLDPQFAAINQSTEVQAQGAQQISAAMSQLTDTSQQTAQSMQESSRAIAQLNQVVQTLQKEIARFKVST